MKEEIETRRQQMKYYFCAVVGVLSLLRKFTESRELRFLHGTWFYGNGRL